MKISKKQLTDLVSIKYFIPKCLENVSITDDDVEKFYLLDSQGKGTKGKFGETNGFLALKQGKQWREWHMREWEKTLYDIPLIEIMEGLPSEVIQYMKKSMKLFRTQIEFLESK